MSVLVVAEHDNNEIKAPSLNAVSAAVSLSDDVHLLVAGVACENVAEQAAQIAGVTKVLRADDASLAHFLAEPMAPLIAKLAPSYSHVIAPATTTGKNILPRAAALSDAQPLSDVVAIESAQVFVRPVYAGNVLAKVETTDKVIFLTVRTTAFDAALADGGSAKVELVEVEGTNELSRFDKQQLATSDRPELTSAKVVVSGGRGVQSSDNFALIYDLADKLEAAVGASRAAVDAGFVANDMQVGQTGKVVAPDLYIAVGISGAIQHLAGMKDSKVIVAINKDEDAPIFQVADYGLVADLFEAVPELIEKL
ncbi:FAD-binding protein [Teredinibacter turnerae]|uniref:electron transfer flavoprotein subunit alpha/FixB family protein n=1 Tax=Teredinibacter turnerae TaxID=2426 RepID=UPI0003640468|nr:FAD-binding protein [Teredinibacter turnerae]